MDKNIQNILDKILAGNASKEEVSMLNDWSKEAKENLQELNKIKDLNHTIDQSATLQAFDSEVAFDRLNSKMENPASSWKKYLLYALWIILFIVTYTSISHFWNKMGDEQKPNIEMAATNTILEEKLPDGTDVSIGLNSKLEILDNRKVRLNGLANFNVTKNPKNPFVVELNHGNITVLGTEFSVFTSQNKEEMYLKEGKIKYTTTNKVQVELKPGDYVTVTDGNVVFLKNVPDNLKNAFNYPLKYTKTNLSQVLDDLGKHYNVKVQNNSNQNLDSMNFSGKLDEDNLKNVLADLSGIYNLEFKLQNDEILISQK